MMRIRSSGWSNVNIASGQKKDIILYGQRGRPLPPFARGVGCEDKRETKCYWMGLRTYSRTESHFLGGKAFYFGTCSRQPGRAVHGEVVRYAAEAEPGKIDPATTCPRWCPKLISSSSPLFHPTPPVFLSPSSRLSFRLHNLRAPLRARFIGP